MHPGAYGKRNMLAQQKLLAAARTLIDRYNLDPELETALRVQSGDPVIRALKEREAVADVLEALAAATKPAAKAKPATKAKPAAAKAKPAAAKKEQPDEKPVEEPASGSAG